jgi:effector-binding domain-containing protein
VAIGGGAAGNVMNPLRVRSTCAPLVGELAPWPLVIGGEEMSYGEVTRRTVAPQPVVSRRGLVAFPELAARLGEFVDQVAAFLREQGVAPAGPPFSRYHGLQCDRVDLEAGLPVAEPLAAIAAAGTASGAAAAVSPIFATTAGTEVQAGTLPGGDVVATIHTGRYEQLPQAGATLDAWAAAHDREAAGPSWEIYHVAPGNDPDPAAWKTEVVKPLR